ncbi:hypothetical protein ACIRST_09020 [Kitasatospora sp. NPDC101447]|uniref:hypothetical protein n=1 Tax=Kitasatospora sp. NPDC101447 TaxID=3364102 RepID=UPI0037F32526
MELYNDGPLPIPAQQSSTTVNPLPLHWVQTDAVAAAVKATRTDGRATVVAATGSGKTPIAPGGARRLAARDVVLVPAPDDQRSLGTDG